MDNSNIDKHEAELLYMIPAAMHSKEKIYSLIKEHTEIKFVSLIGIDLSGNDTDEKIPVNLFLEDFEDFLSGGIQTDGSSVVLPGIATLNDGKVDFIVDREANWFIDYNYEHIDAETGHPVGTLRIPSFLIHNGKQVDSRSILKKSIDYFSSEIKELLRQYPEKAKELGLTAGDIAEVKVIAATELEFWVKTPDDKADIEQLSVSQVLKEQYWKRTKGIVRTALEKSLILLEKYGLKPEMGHKEVGGVQAKVSGDGRLNHIMEQLEIDWKYSIALQSADNELLARILVKETFRRHGLEVTFFAKPIEDVAGSGEHTHVNVTVRLKDGRMVNLFAPSDMKKDFLSTIGWGALMGMMKNYEVINPFITSSNDAFNRLKPGFEAPVCIVASLGSNVETPSRNRTVLAGLVRDTSNPMSVRFEVRSPNPHTNTYLALAAIYQSMLDGIKYALGSGKTSTQLEQEFCKKSGEESGYLERDRAYRSEMDVFEHYTDVERNKFFGTPPATVWDNLTNLSKYPEKTRVLSEGGVFESCILNSYIIATTTKWIMELCERIIPEASNVVRSCIKYHRGNDITDYDEELWTKINALRRSLMKDSLKVKSLFTRIREAIDAKEYDTTSLLQLEMSDTVNELRKLYTAYKRNIMDFEF